MQTKLPNTRSAGVATRQLDSVPLHLSELGRGRPAALQMLPRVLYLADRLLPLLTCASMARLTFVAALLQNEPRLYTGCILSI